MGAGDAGVVVGTTGATVWAIGLVGIETLVLVVVEGNALLFNSDVGACSAKLPA